MALKAVEEAIQQARARGEFDNLKGRGKPLDHDAYFSQPEDVRLANHLLRNAGFVPREVELRREIGELQEQLRACKQKAERTRLIREIDRRRAQIELERG